MLENDCNSTATQQPIVWSSQKLNVMYHVCTLWLFVHRHRESNCIDSMIWYWYDNYSMSLHLFLMIKIDAACCIAMLPLLLEQCIDPSIMHLWWSPAGKRKCCPLARMANRCCIRLSRHGYSAELRKEPCGNDMKRMELGWERWITGASWQNSFYTFFVWTKCNIMKWFAWTCLDPGTLGEIGQYRTWQHHSQGNRAAGIIYSPQRTCRSLPWLPVSVATVKRSQIFWNPWQSPLEDFRVGNIDDINVVPLPNLRGIDWGQSNQGENRSWAQKLWCNMRMNVHGLATFGTKRSILRNKSAKIFPRPQGSVFFGG